MADWLNSTRRGPAWSMLHCDEGRRICKYLDPGTVNDLYQHYLTTRMMTAASAVSYPVLHLLFAGCRRRARGMCVQCVNKVKQFMVV